MKFLKRKVIKTIPVWMLALILIGTVAGAFLWISNLVSNDVTVTDPPIEISGSFESVHYVSMEMISTFPYMLNDPMMAIGYIVIEITQPGMTLADVGGISVLVRPDVGSDITGAVYDTQPISEGYRYVFYDLSFLNPIDFGEGGMATAGEIYVGLTFESTGIFSVSMQISETGL